MKKFLLGVVVSPLVLALGAFLYLKMGYFNMRADIEPSRVEARWAMSFRDASVDRRAPDVKSPVAASPENLLEGMKLYQDNCALCHGAPESSNEELVPLFYPRPPNFIKEAPDMPEYQNFYIIRHGVRWTGMPAWRGVLSDEDCWKLATFLAQMKELPPAVQQEWEHPAGPEAPRETTPK